MMREGLIHLLQSLPPKEQLLSQFPNFEEWWDNSHRWWFCLDFHLNIYYPALVTFVFSIVSRAWLTVIDTMKADFVYKRDNLGKLVTRVNRLADPDHGSAIQSFRKNEELRSKLPNFFWSWAEIPPLWPFVNCINELCNGQSSITFEIYVGGILFLKLFISL